MDLGINLEKETTKHYKLITLIFSEEFQTLKKQEARTMKKETIEIPTEVIERLLYWGFERRDEIELYGSILEIKEEYDKTRGDKNVQQKSPTKN